MTFTQIRNYIKGLFNPIIDELKQDIEDANGVVPINFDDFNHLPQSERDNGKAYFIPDVNFNNQKRPTPTGFTPIGTIISVMGNHAPSHYLICDGTTYNISDYPDLADYFEKEFGTKNNFGGDGETTFAVPDLRGEFLRGTGTNSHDSSVANVKEGSGSNVGEHQAATAMPLVHGNQSSNNYAVRASIIQPTNNDAILQSGMNIAHATASKAATSSGYLFTSRPTNTSVLYCIATCNIYIDTKNIYSTNETIVGEWIDGKSIYQKTVIVNLSAMSAQTTNEIVVINATDGANIELINVFGRLVRNDGYIMVFPLAILTYQNGTTPVNIRIQQRPDKSIVIQYRAYTAQSVQFTAYVTIQYTKTTD